MKKIIVMVAALLISVSVLLLALAPDTLSMIVVGCMWIAVILGFFLGLFPSILYANAFHTAKNNLERTMAVQSTENWIAVFKLDSLFHQKALDRTFSEYKLKVLNQREAKEILSGIEDYISEDSLAIQVDDRAEIQEFRLDCWTTTDIAALISAAALTGSLIVLMAWLLRRRKSEQEGADA